MKIKFILIFCMLLFFVTSTFAINNQDIVNILNLKPNMNENNKLININKNSHFIKWESLYGPKIGKQIKTLQLKNHPDTLFSFRPYSKGKLFRSNDAGKTWDFLPSPINVTLYDLAAIDEQRLILGTDTGIYLSNDRGNHWKIINEMRLQTNNIFTIQI